METDRGCHGTLPWPNCPTNYSSGSDYWRQNDCWSEWSWPLKWTGNTTKVSEDVSMRKPGWQQVCCWFCSAPLNVSQDLRTPLRKRYVHRWERDTERSYWCHFSFFLLMGFNVDIMGQDRYFKFSPLRSWGESCLKIVVEAWTSLY